MDKLRTLVMCTLLYTPLLLVRDCGLAAAVSACADQQFGTNFHMIFEPQTLGDSLNVGLIAGDVSVCVRQEARLIDID